jgi:monovalent cation:H+ antiporter-2, CPA2 family
MVNNILLAIIIISITAIVISYAMKYLKQPYVIGYILGGLIVGPYGLGLITDQSVLAIIGNLGIILLVFFVGMDLSIEKIVSNWKITILGVLVQLVCSIVLSQIIGQVLNWSFQQSIIVAFVLVMSSTAIVIKVLEQWGETNTTLGQNALSISIIHDILAVPLLLIIQAMGNTQVTIGSLITQTISTIVIVGIIGWILYTKKIKLPYVEQDPDITIFIGIALCFGLAYLATIVELSAALGSFIAGLCVSSIRKDTLIKSQLHGFTTVFVAIFFIYIGTQLDFTFVLAEIQTILSMVLSVFILNTVTMAVTLRMLKNSWSESFHAAAILAHIGEFSVIMVLTAMQVQVITPLFGKLLLAVIIITMIFAPIWMSVTKKMMCIDEKHIQKLHQAYQKAYEQQKTYTHTQVQALLQKIHK